MPGIDVNEAVDILWLTAGLSCDGDSVAMTAATQPRLEDLVDGTLPGVPRMRLHHPVLAYEVGDEFLEAFRRAAAGEMDPFILVVEGSLPDERPAGEGYWAAFGHDPDSGEPISTCTWVDRLAPRAWAVVAVGTCAAWGGIHAMAGNPTGAKGVEEHLGPGWRSAGGMPVINLPGCPVQPDNCTGTLLHLLRQRVGQAGALELDGLGRPASLFGETVHECCDRGGCYEQADFADGYGTHGCIVKLGCWGPVVDCNVPRRGWMGGVGGCPNVGGTCIGCTMPGFPDKFMPFLEEPPGARMSASAVVLYGRTVRALREVTRASMQVVPEWRRR